ncbi:hypothetical protein pipiens_003649 [Culex pipiens pipiens]|uniref:Uncharacterized protein n=1 Tax=Culex pipiens pipiens TaxID=38569 RepID=A0ABD1CUB5_CULPP
MDSEHSERISRSIRKRCIVARRVPRYVLKDTRYLWNEELQKNAEKQHKMDLEVMRRINLRNYARELARLEEKRQVEYELECKMLAMRKAADEKMRKMKELLQQQYGVADDKKSADEAQKPVVKKHHSKADHTGAYPKHSTPVNRSDKLPKQPLTPLRNPEIYAETFAGTHSGAIGARKFFRRR